MPIKPQPPAPEPQQSAFSPPQPEPLVCEQWQGINTSTTRPGVANEQLAWCDGFMPIGPRMLRTLYGLGDAIFTGTALNPVAQFHFTSIQATPRMLVFLSDGSIYAVNTVTTIRVLIAPPGTIANPSPGNVGVAQYGNQYVLIVTPAVPGYFIWDGVTFYSPGDVWPPGGTIPTGIQGSSVETYAGRVWISDGANIFFSAPGSLVDFTTASGGGEFTSSDSFLRNFFSRLVQSNGFLYLVGDSSVNYISGVQTSNASPPVTTFTNQNADPEVGSPYSSAVLVYGRSIMFANAFGVHVTYGAAVTKKSEQLDGVYNSVPNFGGAIPSVAKAIVFGKKVFVLLLPIIDPVTGQFSPKLFMWNGTVWWTSEQDIGLSFINYQEVASVLTTYGTDGVSIYPLFTKPSSAFTKTMQSRLWDMPGGYEYNKASTRLWGMAQYFTLEEPDLFVSIDNEIGQSDNTLAIGPTTATWINNNGDVVVWTNNASQVATWYVGGGTIVVFPPTAVAQVGALTGLTVTTVCPDMALISLKLQDQIVQYRG